MVSRETLLQIVAVLVGFGLLVAYMLFADVPDGGFGPLGLAVLAAFYLVIFAGTHVVLALTGDHGGLPSSARLRFAGVVVVLVALGLLGAAVSGADPVLGVRPSTAVLAAGVGLFLSYFVLEARAGYADSMAS